MVIAASARWIFVVAMLVLAACNVEPSGSTSDRMKLSDEAGLPGGDSEAAENRAIPLQSAEERWLGNRFFDLATGFDGYVGIALYDVDRSRLVHFNGEEFFPQQSVSKLWVALTALDMADSGLLDLNETATVRYGDLTVFHQPIRKQVVASGRFTSTYRDYLRRALTESDNTANDMALTRAGGPEVVRMTLERKGLADIRFGPGERAMQSEIAGLEWRQHYAIGKNFFDARKRVPNDVRRRAFDDYVTDPVDGARPNAMVAALALLARGELLSAQNTALFLNWLDQVKSGPNRLKGGVPPGWSMGHKTGTGQVLDIVPPGVMGEQAGYNDVGILTAPDGSRYAIAVMVGRTRRPVPERMDLMHAVIGAVVDYHAVASGELPYPPDQAAEPISSPHQP